MARPFSVTDRPTGENLASSPDDYSNIPPGASPFFQLDSSEYSLENFTPSQGIPANPQDYLRSVMLEARNCPDVVVAKARPKPRANNLNLQQAAPPPGIELAPTQEWCDIQLYNFSVSRAEYSRHVAQLKSIKRQTKKRPKLPIYPLPTPDDEESWKYITLGNQHVNNLEGNVDVEISNCNTISTSCIEEQRMPEVEADEERVVDLSSLKNGFPPLLRILLRMESSHVESNLEFHVNWLRSYGFSRQQGRWMYALLICLEKPLFPSVISSLRDLSRECARLRTSQTSEGSELLNGMNLIICIVGKYFDQFDLLDKLK